MSRTGRPPIYPIDLSGMRFARWLVLHETQRNDHGLRFFLCRCNCTDATEKEVARSSLLNGVSRSCGCLQRELQAKRRTTHGATRADSSPAATRTYHSWCAMRARCSNPKNQDWQNYGAKGIKVCARWRSFIPFLADMGESPSAGHSFERIDRAGDYTPGNVKWGTAEEQANNTSKNVFLEHNGERFTVAQWARRLGIEYQTLAARIDAGWPITRALTKNPPEETFEKVPFVVLEFAPIIIEPPPAQAPTPLPSNFRGEDLRGQAFGRLRVLSLGPNRGRWTCWRCLCSCGLEVIVAARNLCHDSTRSCGCLMRELSERRATHHGLSGTPEYYVWTAMLDRCRNLNSPQYKDYGGRGITVCNQWLDFTAFITDVGRRPRPDLTIDRINNDGNYEPGNCRWATRWQQSHNRGEH